MSTEIRNTHLERCNRLAIELNIALEKAYIDGYGPTLATMYTPHSVSPHRESLGLPRCHHVDFMWFGDKTGKTLADFYKIRQDIPS